jgi:hypothetical protein
MKTQEVSQIIDGAFHALPLDGDVPVRIAADLRRL